MADVAAVAVDVLVAGGHGAPFDVGATLVERDRVAVLAHEDVVLGDAHLKREPHVVDEKEPDVRVRAKATDACVSIEIKVVESWSLPELDDALEVQLCGRYLRSDQGRYGVLLLVHQKSRPKGWEDKAAGKYLSFMEVVDRLRARALAISGESHNSPQPEVAVLDVCVAPLK